MLIQLHNHVLKKKSKKNYLKFAELRNVRTFSFKKEKLTL